GSPVPVRAVGLPWLRPSAAALLALTADPPDVATVLDDPGLLVHVLRYARPAARPTDFQVNAASLSQPAFPAAAAVYLDQPRGAAARFATQTPAALRLGRFAARVARALAEETRLCEPDAAWAAGLLAPLGWYAAAESDDAPPDDLPALGRRLAARWRLPPAFAVTLGFLRHPPADAVRLGGHSGLHRIARAAVSEAERRLGPVGLLPDPATDADLDPLARRVRDFVEPPFAFSPDPDPVLLGRLLRATAAARQRSAAALVGELERQVGVLSELLAESRGGFETTVRNAKLGAMAEFAAGASHEINNPLAIISGNAQLLLAGEDDPDRHRRLSAVVRAAGRVHDILAGARQFARPAAPTPVAVRVRDAVFRAIEPLLAVAAEREITLETEVSPDLIAHADPVQLTTAVANLARNGIEAAPPGGWVRVRSLPADGRVVVAVEDSGAGPHPDHLPHLFDPFFCGRTAGRNRGLGLAVAWRLAAQNGGSVEFAPVSGGPTRFTLTLPAGVGVPDTFEQSGRRTA
ncbi:MAG: ATP-binding protein, partial [Fimbriiglobus sp.]